jgi:hypothetical protein
MFHVQTLVTLIQTCISKAEWFDGPSSGSRNYSGVRSARRYIWAITMAGAQTTVHNDSIDRNGKLTNAELAFTLHAGLAPIRFKAINTTATSSLFVLRFTFMRQSYHHLTFILPAYQVYRTMGIVQCVIFLPDTGRVAWSSVCLWRQFGLHVSSGPDDQI